MFRAPKIDLKRRAPALGLIALYAYLAFHAFSGSQGVLKRKSMPCRMTGWTLTH